MSYTGADGNAYCGVMMYYDFESAEYQKNNASVGTLEISLLLKHRVLIFYPIKLENMHFFKEPSIIIIAFLCDNSYRKREGVENADNYFYAMRNMFFGCKMHEMEVHSR